MASYAIKTPPQHGTWGDFLDVWRATEAWARLNELMVARSQAIGRDPDEIRRSVHLFWPADADPARSADSAAAFADAGVDLVIFSMRGPYDAGLLEPLATALTR